MQNMHRLLILLTSLYFVQIGNAGVGHVWTYDKTYGPSKWPIYYKHCGGKQQSPINIETSSVVLNANIPVFDLRSYAKVNNVHQMLENVVGHTVEVKYSGEPLVINGGGLLGEYKLEQFHFHWGLIDDRGSEHKLDGQQFPMEMHIVHYSSKYDNISEAMDKPNGLAVLAFFFEIGSHNPAFEDLLAEFHKVRNAGDKTDLTSIIQLSSLLPTNTSIFWRYYGSLTTPPCFESVLWTVFYEKIVISEKQMLFYRSLDKTEKDEREQHLLDDYRPIQPRNQRYVQTNNVIGTLPISSSNKVATVYLLKLVVSLLSISFLIF